MNEFMTAYGPVDAVFQEDMFALETMLGLAVHESFNKPNVKQRVTA